MPCRLRRYAIIADADLFSPLLIRDYYICFCFAIDTMFYADAAMPAFFDVLPFFAIIFLRRYVITLLFTLPCCLCAAASHTRCYSCYYSIPSRAMPYYAACYFHAIVIDAVI